MRKNQEYKNAALAALKGSWPQAVIATFAMMVVSGLGTLAMWIVDKAGLLTVVSDPVAVAIVAVSAVLYSTFLMMPLLVGIINAFNRLYYKSDRAVLSNTKDLTLEDTLRSIAGMFLMSIVTSVCSLALIVPGVLASFSLFLTPFLLKDNPELSLVDTLRLSHKMMRGHKMQLFKLQLSFLGWGLLNVLTLGIGSLWLVPYILTTMAAFYQDVREQYIMKGDLQESAS